MQTDFKAMPVCTRPVSVWPAFERQDRERIGSSCGLKLTLVVEHLTVGPVTGNTNEGIRPVIIFVDP
jgi:hypothetical protein